jgi:glucose uptake protein GlcU
MKEKCKGNWQGMGLILAGTVVFLVGLTIILFKELDIPRYWIPAVIGLVLIVAGAIVHSIKRVYNHQQS